ncbi:MAG TPA: protein kinase [Opitutaceae bacterium]|nr:protein kinase [Opitutaceae bacterium]
MEKPPIIPDFTLLRRIGGGSYGDVWLGRSVTGIYRAVKLVARSRFADASPYQREFEGITRFQKAVGDQPQQLALLHVGEDAAQGLLFYVMELADDAIEGTDIDPATYVPLTLKEFYHRRPHVPADECIDIAVSLTRALVGLHEAGLIHRDVKPSNIIFVNRVPKLADIGLVSSSEHTMTSLGTPGYAPPEGGGTTQADVYGLGKIIYQLSTGLGPADFPRLPADATSRADVARLMELNEVFLRACHPEPAQRYQTAQALLDDLLLLQAGRSVKELIRTRERFRLLRRVSVAAAIVALVVVSALGVQNYLTLRKLAAQEKTAREKAEADERLARYSADLHIAQLALASGDYGNSRSALRRQIPKAGETDLRGPEWNVLWNKTKGDQQRVYGQIGDAPIRAFRLSPDEKFMAVQTNANVTFLLDLATGAKRQLAENTQGLGDFTADGAQLTVGTPDRKVRRIEVATGQLTPEQSVRGRLVAAAKDHRTVLVGEYVGNGFDLIGWDAVAERETGRWSSGPWASQLALTAFALSADGRLLAACITWSVGTEWKNELVVWNLAEGALVGRVPVAELYNLTFSADAKQLFIAESERPAKVLATATLQVIETLPYAGSRQANELTAADAGSLLAKSSSDHSIAIARYTPGNGVAGEVVYRGHESTVVMSAWSKTAETLWSASLDGTIREWRRDAPAIANSLPMSQGDRLGDAIFSPDGAELAVSTRQNTIQLYSSADLSPRQEIPALFHPVAYTASGGSLAGIDKQNRLLWWDRASNTTRTSKLAIGDDQRIKQTFAAPDGTLAAIVLTNEEIRVWDLVGDKELFVLKGHETELRVLAIHPAKQLLASTDRSGVTKLWSLRDGQLLDTLPTITGGAYALAFSPRGDELAVSSYTGSWFQSWNVEKRTMGPKIDGHSAMVTHLQWLPVAQRFVSASRDGSIGIWTPDFRYRLATLQPDPRSAALISRVRFSEERKKAAVLMRGGLLLIFDYQ